MLKIQKAQSLASNISRHSSFSSMIPRSVRALPVCSFLIPSRQAALYHDGIEGDVFVSQNEGKSWSLVDGVPRGDAAIVIDHPFDNRYVSYTFFSSRVTLTPHLGLHPHPRNNTLSHRRSRKNLEVLRHACSPSFSLSAPLIPL
jgi:hypothetical protein